MQTVLIHCDLEPDPHCTCGAVEFNEHTRIRN